MSAESHAPITVAQLRAVDPGAPASATLLAARTITMGPLWVRFENRHTLLVQLAQTVRTEGIEDAAALQAECDVYSELTPPGALLVTVGINPFDADKWRAWGPALQSGLTLLCNDTPLAPAWVVPAGQRCQALFQTTGAHQALLRDAHATILLAVQLAPTPLSVRVPQALHRAFSQEL